MFTSHKGRSKEIYVIRAGVTWCDVSLYLRAIDFERRTDEDAKK